MTNIYPTSVDEKAKTAVCVLLEKDGLFLSVTRKNDHTDFGLPGGKLDFGETLIQCAKREVLEETGYELDISPYNPFMKLDENGVFTITFKANFTTDNPTKQSTCEKETGLVSFVNKEQLYSGSFGDYNKAMLTILDINMTNDEKAQRALAALDPIRIANRLQQRRKQAINNARVTDMSRSLLVEIQKDLLPNERVTIYHVSHMLNRFGVPHFRSYDKKRFNGITFAFVSTGETNSPVKIYTAFCDKSDTYSRKLGRLEVLDRIQKDLISTKKGTPISKHNPILLDTVAAFKYLNPLSGNVNKQSIVRASIDWYITTHVNKPKKVQKSVEYTRSQVAEAEKALVSKAEKDLRNIADLRVVYSHTAPDSLGFNVPLAIRRLEDPNYRAIRETTKVKLALAATQRNSELSEEVVESLKEVLESSSVEVHRHKDDKPNRVNARMFALRKFVKTNF